MLEAFFYWLRSLQRLAGECPFVAGECPLVAAIVPHIVKGLGAALYGGWSSELHLLIG